MVKQRLDYEIYRVRCPHLDVIRIETSEWCDYCGWVEGEAIGDFAIVWYENGEIAVLSSGGMNEGKVQ